MKYMSRTGEFPLCKEYLLVVAHDDIGYPQCEIASPSVLW